MKASVSLTTKWDNKSYRAIVLDQLESYFVETAIDSDSDPWQVAIGDPDHALIETLRRNNEVRVRLFGAGYGTKLLMTGIADEISFNESGVLTINGRDMSSLATDSTIPPKQWQHVNASVLIPEQAKEIGMPGPFNITTKGTVKKVQYTDASESYWDFWYRLVRKDRMFIWTSPEGALFTGLLNYNEANTYFFGNPPSNASESERSRYVPIETFEMRKTTQDRVGEIRVYWQRGDVGGMVKLEDADTSGWIKRPRRILMDSEATSSKSAVKLAQEEIYESQVGAVEVRITIPDQGWVVQQNHMAHVRLPELGIEGDWFVVGTRVQADTQGFIQEVRLREKNYAVSKRVPADPKPPEDVSQKTATELGQVLAVKWGDFFVAAAKKWHGVWDFNLYLATLLGICDQETGFTNERQNGGPGGSHISWYQWTAATRDTDPRGGDGIARDTEGRSRRQYEEVFANEIGGAYGLDFEYGVGPMQLTSRSYKTDADDLFKTGFRNEFEGGRWHPQWNIMVAAHALRGKLQASVGDSGRDVDIWQGVKAYNGSGPAAEAYMQSVRHKVTDPGGYLSQVKDAIQTAIDNANRPTNPPSSNAGSPSDPAFGPLGKGFDYSRNIIGFPGQGTHSFTASPNNWQSDNAVDIACPFGTPVYAVSSGHVGCFGILPECVGRVVVQTSGQGGDRFAGNRVNINGTTQKTYYAHLSRLNPLIATFGLWVKAGTLLGWSGEANGIKHLHFGCERGNPFQFIPGGDPR